MIVFRTDATSVPPCSRPSRPSPSGGRQKGRPALTATRHDGAGEPRSGRKNGSAGVKQKNEDISKLHARFFASRYVRGTIVFRVTKTRTIADSPVKLRGGAYIIARFCKPFCALSMSGAGKC